MPGLDSVASSEAPAAVEDSCRTPAAPVALAPRRLCGRRPGEGKGEPLITQLLVGSLVVMGTGPASKPNAHVHTRHPGSVQTRSPLSDTRGRGISKAAAVFCLALAVSAPAAYAQDAPDGRQLSAVSTSLEPGDAIRVEIWREPDLSGVFDIDERGTVTLPLLGDHKVAGLSADSLRDALVAEYAEYLQNPSIDVTLLRRVSILGEVRSPGLYPVDATITLAEALALAGGVAPNGNKNDINLIRDGEVIPQNLEAAAVVGSTDIRSGDQIIVGERSWASRHSGAIIGSAVAAAAIIGAALISN